MYRFICAGAACLGLAACGGTTTSSTPTPLSENGFATDTSEIVFGDSFTLPDVTRIVGAVDGTLSADNQEVIINIQNQGDGVEVELDGVTYLLAPDGSVDFTYADGDDQVLFSRIGEVFEEAEVIEIFADVDGKLNSSLFVFGYDTDPADVAARTGSASMSGSVYATVRSGFDTAFAEGDATMTADFARGTVSGGFNVTNRPSDRADFTVPDLTFALENAPILENTFAGTLSLAEGALGGTIEDASYKGRFFGAGADIAGGQILARITVLGSDSPTFLEGAFLVGE